MPAVSEPSPPIWQRLLEHVCVGAVFGLLTVAGVTGREATVEERPVGEAFAYAWRAAIVLGIGVAVVSAGWEWASSGNAADIEDKSRDTPGDGETMTRGERAQVIACCGFREPIGTDNLHMKISMAVLSVSMVGLGLFWLVFGEGAERLGALALLAAGMPPCWLGWKFLRRRVAPASDADLAREVRHRQERED